MRAADRNIPGNKELGGTTGSAGSHGGTQPLLVTGRLCVTLGQKFSPKTLAWVNGYFLIE